MGRALWVRMLFVLAEYQRRGVGRLLLNQAQRQADETGLPVRLRVMKVNPARTFYEQNGFQVYKEADEFFYMERAATGAPARRSHVCCGM